MRRKLRRLHRVIHLRRKQVGAVVSETALALMFLEGKRHHGVDAEIRPIFDPVETIEDLADAMRADVSAQIIFGVEDADVKLIDDEVIESGRTKASIVPGVVRGLAYDAIAIWIAVELKLARIGVALEAFTAGANHIEAIKITVFDARHKPGPEAEGIFGE